MPPQRRMRSAGPAEAGSRLSRAARQLLRRPGNIRYARDGRPGAGWRASPGAPTAPAPELRRRLSVSVKSEYSAMFATSVAVEIAAFEIHARVGAGGSWRRMRSKRISGSRTSFQEVWLISRRLRTQTPTPYEPSGSAVTLDPRAAISSSRTSFRAGTSAHSSCSLSGVLC